MDPLDEHLYARIVARRRGFDLGDDEAVLAWMLPAWRDGKLPRRDRWLLAVICIRTDQLELAFKLLRDLDQRGDSSGEARYLSAWVAHQQGRWRLALQLLEAHCEAIGTVWVEHLKGEILLSQGQVAPGLSCMHGALAKDDLDLVRWYDLAEALLDAGMYEESEQTFEELLRRSPHHGDAHYGLALARACLDKPKLAIESLAASSLTRELRTTALREARLESIRDHKTFRQLVSPPQPPDLTWLAAFPLWLRTLASDRRLLDAGMRWVARDISDAHTRRVRARYSGGAQRPPGVLWTSTLWAACREGALGQRLVAVGPVVVDRDHIEHPMHWYIDVDEAQLWLALDADVPPALRLPAGDITQAVLAAIGEFHPRPMPSMCSFQKTWRAYVGHIESLSIPDPYTGEPEPARPHVLSRLWATSPFIDDYRWGSSRDEDPWPAALPPQPQLASKIRAFQREAQRQDAGGRCRFSRRTRFSGSIITLELHAESFYVCEVRYNPCAHADANEALSRRCGFSLPWDMPIDVLGTLIGFEAKTSEDITKQVARYPVSLQHWLPVQAAIDGLTHEGSERLRRYAGHVDPSIRETAITVAARYNWEFVLEDMLLVEVDPRRRAGIRELLDGGTAPPAYDEHGDPLGLLELT